MGRPVAGVVARLIVHAITAATALLVVATIATTSVAIQRPNIVFLLSDDHAHDALSCAGHPVLKTPSLDRLAAGGVRFTHCFVPNPICTPARAAIFTGQDSWTNDVYFFGRPIKEGSPLWPKLLTEAGYETFFTGKWHNDGRPEERGFTHAASMWLGGEYNHAALPVVQQGKPRQDRTPLEKLSSTAFVEAAMEFLEARARAAKEKPSLAPPCQGGERLKPFCLFISFTAPHDPWIPPGEYAAMYQPDEIPLPANFMPKPPFAHGDWFAELRDQRQVPYPRTEENVRKALSLYYGMITQMDAQIGRLLDRLDELKLADDTLVIFVGDHGYSLGSHGFVGKQCMYEEGIRTPLIVRYPKWQRGRETNNALVSLIDFFPTICAAAEVRIPARVEGRSLADLYQGKAPAEEFRRELFAAFYSPERHHMSTRCIRTERYKYVQHLLTGEEELFDLQNDPAELRSLHADAAHQKRRNLLREKLIAWGKDTPQAAAAKSPR